VQAGVRRAGRLEHLSDRRNAENGAMQRKIVLLRIQFE
jgi:hypothetical protein